MKKVQWLVVIALTVFVSGTAYAEDEPIPDTPLGITTSAAGAAAGAAVGVGAAVSAAQDQKAEGYIVDTDKAKQQIEMKNYPRTLKADLDIKDRVRIPMEVTGRVFAFSRWADTSVCSAFIKDASGNDIEINSDKIVCTGLAEALAKPVDVTVKGLSRQGKIAANELVIHGNANQASASLECGTNSSGEQVCQGAGYLNKARFSLGGCFGVLARSEETHLLTDTLCKEIASWSANDYCMIYAGKLKPPLRTTNVELEYVSSCGVPIAPVETVGSVGTDAK